MGHPPLGRGLPSQGPGGPLRVAVPSPCSSLLSRERAQAPAASLPRALEALLLHTLVCASTRPWFSAHFHPQASPRMSQNFYFPGGETEAQRGEALARGCRVCSRAGSGTQASGSQATAVPAAPHATRGWGHQGHFFQAALQGPEGLRLPTPSVGSGLSPHPLRIWVESDTHLYYWQHLARGYSSVDAKLCFVLF